VYSCTRVLQEVSLFYFRTFINDVLGILRRYSLFVRTEVFRTKIIRRIAQLIALRLYTYTYCTQLHTQYTTCTFRDTRAGITFNNKINNECTVALRVPSKVQLYMYVIVRKSLLSFSKGEDFCGSSEIRSSIVS
jgi:hypothetical protein